MARKMDVPRKHQMNIAKKTLKLSDIGARILGGMTKETARRILRESGLYRSGMEE